MNLRLNLTGTAVPLRLAGFRFEKRPRWDSKRRPEEIVSHLIGQASHRAGVPLSRADLRIWCEYWGVFDRIDRTNLLLEKRLKKFWIF